MRQGWQRLQNSGKRDPLMAWQHLVGVLTAMTLVFTSGCSQHGSAPTTSDVDETSSISPSERVVLEGQGWFVTSNGIYARYCNDPRRPVTEPACSTAEVRGDDVFWLLEVWCPDKKCGEVYGELGILDGNKVIARTNSTVCCLDKGMKGLLTFQKRGLKGGYSAGLQQLTSSEELMERIQ